MELLKNDICELPPRSLCHTHSSAYAFREFDLRLVMQSGKGETLLTAARPQGSSTGTKPRCWLPPLKREGSNRQTVNPHPPRPEPINGKRRVRLTSDFNRAYLTPCHSAVPNDAFEPKSCQPNLIRFHTPQGPTLFGDSFG